MAVTQYMGFAPGLLFDWLYPTHMPVLRCCLEAWADTPDVTNAALKFMAEFVLNKTQRLTFDSSSPNGILLFREVSKVWFLLCVNKEKMPVSDDCRTSSSSLVDGHMKG